MSLQLVNDLEALLNSPGVDQVSLFLGLWAIWMLAGVIVAGVVVLWRLR